MLDEHKKSFQGSETLERYEKDLVAEGLISADQLSIARISQDNLGLDLGSVLIKKGYVTEKKLLQFMAIRLGVPFLSLSGESVNPEILHKLPLHLAKKYQAIPITFTEDGIRLAMANPFDKFILEDLREILKTKIEPCLVSGQEIEDTLNRYYGDNLATGNEKLIVDIIGENSQSLREEDTRKIQELASGPRIVSAVDGMIARAASEGASDIHVEPTRNMVMIRYRVDGLLKEVGRLNKNMHLPVVSRIKILAGLDIAERRVPQDGRVRVLMVAKPLDMRISTCPTQFGEKVVIRLLSKEKIRSIEDLGFADKERKVFCDTVSKSHGIFLVTGPTGSGKSTTLYAALSRINSSEKNIISIEDPIESEIEGINQVAVNSKANLTFAGVLRSVLRQDPDVIMIGEIRDAETAQIAVRAAITGHLVLSTLHTNTASGALSRLVDLGVEPFLLSSALKGVLAQRLVRQICIHCRFEVKPELLKGASTKNLPLKKAFQGKGCKACGYTGYKGRIAIFELAAINDAARVHICERAPEAKIIEEFRKMGVKSILQDGLEKVERGITTLEEVLRVTQED